MVMHQVHIPCELLIVTLIFEMRMVFDRAWIKSMNMQQSMVRPKEKKEKTQKRRDQVRKEKRWKTIRGTALGVLKWPDGKGEQNGGEEEGEGKGKKRGGGEEQKRRRRGGIGVYL